MNKKVSLVGSALALVCLSGASYAETFGNSPKGSIVVISKHIFMKSMCTVIRIAKETFRSIIMGQRLIPTTRNCLQKSNSSAHRIVGLAMEAVGRTTRGR